MDYIGIWIRAIRRINIDIGKKWNKENGFYRSNGHPHYRRVGFAWLMVFIVGSQSTLSNVSGYTLLFLILSGFATGALWLCYFKALTLEDVNKVVPIDKSSTVLTIILAFLLLGEKLTTARFAGIILIAIGTYMMIQKKAGIEQKKDGKAWLIYALLSALFASLTAILGKVGITGIESNLGTAIRTIVLFFMAWIMVWVTGKMNEITRIDKKELLFICLSGFATGGSWLCYYKALQDGPASVVVPIDKMSILVTVVFAYLVFKEKLTKKSFLGLILLTTGTLVMLIP